MMSNKRIIIGTRPSELAVAQGEIIADKLNNFYPKYTIKLKKISTRGDRILDKQLAEISGKGLFIKEIEVALLNKEIDMAVHSYKDLPTTLPKEVKVGAVPVRTTALDTVITKNNLTLENLPQGARLGTGSLRRKSQLLRYRPDLNIIPIRGNIDTRLKKLYESDLDGLVLAAAGLERMGWQDKISQYLDPEICVPAPRQGAMAIEIRKEDKKIERIVRKINDSSTFSAVQGEFYFLKYLQGGCSAPIGAYAQIQDEKLNLRGIVARPDGSRVVKEQIRGNKENAQSLGVKLAQRLVERGAEDILENVKGGSQ
jgi:hydroxymethylbilane synthase